MCLVCVIRFAHIGLAGQRRAAAARPSNRLSRLRNQLHAWKEGRRKDGRNRISSSFMRPSVGRRPLYLPSLRFRALVRRLPPVSFFAPSSSSRSSLSSVRPFVVPITAAAAAPALPSRHALRTLNYGQTTQHASSVCPPPARPPGRLLAEY